MEPKFDILLRRLNGHIIGVSDAPFRSVGNATIPEAAPMCGKRHSSAIWRAGAHGRMISGINISNGAQYSVSDARMLALASKKCELSRSRIGAAECGTCCDESRITAALVEYGATGSELLRVMAAPSQ